MVSNYNKLDCYFGIRPTSDYLHLGHAMTLFNMFEYIINNKSKINNIYILLAEIHAEISQIDKTVIHNNAIILSQQIKNLFSNYLLVNNFSEKDCIFLKDKLVFIFQNNYSNTHIQLTYNFFSLIGVGKLQQSPIFENSKNKSVAFLVYPILQAFDVFLYSQSKIPMIVFMGGDQRTNINIMKDIATKLKIVEKNIVLSYETYNEVLYDNKGLHKMSKSLNNFIALSDFDDIKRYIFSYKTFFRPTINAIGDPHGCLFYNQLGKEIERVFPSQELHFDKCIHGAISCTDCKKNVFNILSKVFTNISQESLLNTKNTMSKIEKNLNNNFNMLMNLINEIRSI